jgi:hypothetical protein
MTTALITGATAGIGAAFARALASRGSDIVIVARDVDRLTASAESIAREFGVSVEVLSADLSVTADLASVEARLMDPHRPISTLVNNAGFGVKGSFARTTIAEEQRMLDVLVTATLRLSHAVLPGMLERRAGAIVNVSSVAGWITGGTYSAAKAWVTVFSESLATECRGLGVQVTAVCPGYVRTEFHERAGMNMDGTPDWLWLNAKSVADKALRDSAAGKALSVTGLQYRVLAGALRHSPRWVVRRASRSRPAAERFPSR